MCLPQGEELRKLTFAAAIVFAFSMVTPQRVTAAPPEGEKVAGPRVDDRGVVHYAFDPSSIPGYHLVRDVGRAENDECVFSASGEGSPSDRPQVTRMVEVDFDPSECSRTLAVATYAAPRLVSNGRMPQASLKTALAATSYSGYLQSMVEDPVEKDVTRTRSTVNWSATSSCVTSSTRSPYWYWYSPTDWSRVYGTILGSYTTCSSAWLSIDAKYKNDGFCPGEGNTTYANHRYNIFEGRPGGKYYWAYSMSKSGGCSSLLHYGYELAHP